MASKEEQAAYFKEYRRRNSARIRARLRSKRLDPEWQAKRQTYLQEYNQRPGVREQIYERRKRYREANADKELARRLRYFETHPDYLKNQSSRTRERMGDAAREYHRNYNRERTRRDPAFALVRRLRRRLSRLVEQGRATNHTRCVVELTGCTLEHLIQHLERQFQHGMTWANQGEWHIDHIQPCCTFDLTNVDQQKACFRYTNLRPLWRADNLKKIAADKHAKREALRKQAMALQNGGQQAGALGGMLPNGGSIPPPQEG